MLPPRHFPFSRSLRICNLLLRGVLLSFSKILCRNSVCGLWPYVPGGWTVRPSCRSWPGGGVGRVRKQCGWEVVVGLPGVCSRDAVLGVLSAGTLLPLKRLLMSPAEPFY